MLAQAEYYAAVSPSVPVTVQESLSVCDGRVSGQHAKRRCFSCTVYPQQAETLQGRRTRTDSKGCDDSI